MKLAEQIDYNANFINNIRKIVWILECVNEVRLEKQRKATMSNKNYPTTYQLQSINDKKIKITFSNPSLNL